MEIFTTKQLGRILFMLVIVCGLLSCEDEEASVDSVPVVQLTSPVIESFAGKQITISANITDEAGLSTIDLQQEEWMLNKRIQLEGSPKEYELRYKFTLPDDLPIDSEHTIELRVANAGNKITEIAIPVKIIELLQFDRMFLTDVFTAAELTSDLYGVPMLMTSSTNPADAGYIFTTNYYSAAAGTEIKFIPQETSFEPNVFGAKAGVEGGLAKGNDAPAIILPAKGYYEIEVDVRDMSYTATAYVPTEALQPTMYMAGAGFDGQNWDPSVATEMTLNSLNPYEFSVETDVAATTVQWIFIHSRSWNLPYWRFDNASQPRKVIPSINSDMGGTNINIAVPAPTTYKVTFDYHLNHSKAVKQ